MSILYSNTRLKLQQNAIDQIEISFFNSINSINYAIQEASLKGRSNLTINVTNSTESANSIENTSGLTLEEVLNIQNGLWSVDFSKFKLNGKSLDDLAEAVKIYYTYKGFVVITDSSTETIDYNQSPEALEAINTNSTSTSEISITISWFPEGTTEESETLAKAKLIEANNTIKNNTQTS